MALILLSLTLFNNTFCIVYEIMSIMVPKIVVKPGFQLKILASLKMRQIMPKWTQNFHAPESEFIRFFLIFIIKLQDKMFVETFYLLSSTGSENNPFIIFFPKSIIKFSFFPWR